MASGASGRRRAAARLHARTAVLIAAILAGGCASTSDQPALAPLTTGTAPPLDADEMTWNCGRLENAIDIKIARIVELQKQAKTEAENAAPTLEKLFGRWSFGNTEANNTALAKIKAERAKAEIYNARLPDVDCTPIDIDARIAATKPK